MPQAVQRRMQKVHAGLYSYLKPYQGEEYCKKELHVLQIRRYQLLGQRTGSQ